MNFVTLENLATATAALAERAQLGRRATAGQPQPAHPRHAPARRPEPGVDRHHSSGIVMNNTRYGG
jgi:hypothetical protein